MTIFMSTSLCKLRNLISRYDLPFSTKTPISWDSTDGCPLNIDYAIFLSFYNHRVNIAYPMAILHKLSFWYFIGPMRFPSPLPVTQQQGTYAACQDRPYRYANPGILPAKEQCVYRQQTQKVCTSGNRGHHCLPVFDFMVGYLRCQKRSRY